MGNRASESDGLKEGRKERGPIAHGARNNTLFAELKRLVAHVPNEDALISQAIKIKEAFDPPLELEEVRRVAGSVWLYRVEERLIRTAEQAIVTRSAVFNRLRAHPNGADAFFLLGLLQLSPGAEPGKRFAIVTRSMVEYKLLAGWTVRRYRRAVATLIEAGLLRCVRKGGSCQGDPHLYNLTQGEPSFDQAVA